MTQSIKKTKDDFGNTIFFKNSWNYDYSIVITAKGEYQAQYMNEAISTFDRLDLAVDDIEEHIQGN